MQRPASILWLIVVITLTFTAVPSHAVDTCWYDDYGRLKCRESGVLPGYQGDPIYTPGYDPEEYSGPRYVYVVPVDDGDEDEYCHFWSDTPGGLDSWDPGDDGEVIEANSLPDCEGEHIPPVDVPGTAWTVFNSWVLESPDPYLQPSDHGITGLPTYLSSPLSLEVEHVETLPDGRILRVSAEVVEFIVDWGDGEQGTYDPSEAQFYPLGTVTHEYRTKTCAPYYRVSHPSGGLCHATLSYYTIRAINRWSGRYDVGSGWVLLGALDMESVVEYDVDELRGVPIPTE